MRLKNKHILLGVTGSIAAFKIPEFLRLLQREGASVQVMATRSACEFVTPLTLQTLSGYPVLTDLFARVPADGSTMIHLQPSREADLTLIAPATANTLAKLAHGLAEDLLASMVLGSAAPVLLVPAMNPHMWNNPLTQENLRKLRKAYNVMEPEEGILACGEYGSGRLPSLEAILELVVRMVTAQDLRGKKVLIAAGATREYLDPVRFFSNASSGKMALSLAQEAYARGAEVTVIKAFSEVSFEPLKSAGVKIIQVTSAREMLRETLSHAEVDVFLSPAAIADYTPAIFSRSKIKKNLEHFQPLLQRTVDVLTEVGKRKHPPVRIGFALEDCLDSKLGLQKMKQKKLDMLLVNKPATLGSDEIEALLCRPQGCSKIGLGSKQDASRMVFDVFVKDF